MAGTKLNIKTETGLGYSGYLALPAKAKGPGMLVVQEIFGVNSHIREVCDLYAAAGFVALAPDVFWRAQPNVELTYSPEDAQTGIALMQKCDQKQILQDFGAALKALRAVPECTDKVGVVGYCFGGTAAYHLACHDMVDCAVGYYGGGIDKALDQAKNLSRPLMLHFGEKDNHISMESVDKVRQALTAKGVEVFVYPADHGFNCDQRPSYDRQSAMIAYGRSMVFFNKTLF